MTNRVLLGNFGSSYGLKVSKPGFDVLTANDANLLFNSDFPMYRYRYSITTSLTMVSPQASATTSINHNLGVVPMLMFGVTKNGSDASTNGTYYGYNVANIEASSTQIICTVRKFRNEDATFIFHVSLFTENI